MSPRRPPTPAARGGASIGGSATEPVAIIGGAAITLLAGRIRRRHTIADLESPTTELSLTLAMPPADHPAVVHPAGGLVRDAGRPTGRSGRRREHAARSRQETDRPVAHAGTTPRLSPRVPRTPVVVAAIGALAAVATAGAVLSSRSDPAAAPTGTGPTAPQSAFPAAPPTTAPPPSATPDRVQAYLGALRAADIPASRSGEPETEAAAAICEQSRRGVADTELARSLPAMLTEVDRRQAPTVVELAKRYYCP